MFDLIGRVVLVIDTSPWVERRIAPGFAGKSTTGTALAVDGGLVGSEWQ
jgi:hypothetical protein